MTSTRNIGLLRTVLLFSRSIACVLLLILAACGGGGGDSGNEQAGNNRGDELPEPVPPEPEPQPPEPEPQPPEPEPQPPEPDPEPEPPEPEPEPEPPEPEPEPEPTIGLDLRPQNIDCIAPDRPRGASTFELTSAFPDLPAFSGMTKVLVEPVNNPRWFVLQKSGELLVFDPDNALSSQVYIDLSGVVRTNSEGGLLGMAFHPDYPVVPEIFLSYTRDHSDPPMRSVISRFILDDTIQPGPGTVEQVLLQVDQERDNHNGGEIAFGPDNFLYIGFGDGGGAGDPNGRAQDTRYLLGSFLRIDVLDPTLDYPVNKYRIPPDNPFASNPNCGAGLNAASCPEIYAWGLRNPWRWSFDSQTGVLWAADVGQGDWEEVNQITRGGNYGWDCREGSHDFEPDKCLNLPLVDPIAEYDHSEGRSITGGFVYRGTELAELAGRYVFTDYATGRIWALQGDGQGGYGLDELLDSSLNPSTMVIDQDNELYVADYAEGGIWKLVATAGEYTDTVPDNLTDSGCVDTADPTLTYAGLIPYTPAAPFWSDGAAKDRHLAIPDVTTVAVNGQDDFVFPPGTVLVKNFRLNDKLIETRHLMRHPDGVWAGYTYEWNAAQTEATRVRGGKTISIEGQDWIFPSESDCLLCHTKAAGVALAPELAQLNFAIEYPQTGRTANQLHTLNSIGLLSPPLTGNVDTLPSIPNPTDQSVSLYQRSRAYLHTNCAQCHRPGGPTPVDLDLRFETSLQDTNACGVVPTAGDSGLSDPQIIFPGRADRSVLLARMSLRDASGMPPLGSAQLDEEGIAMLRQWINALQSCNEPQ